MKRTTTFLLGPLLIGLFVAGFGLTSLGLESLNVWQSCLAVVAVLLAALTLGAVLNFAIFAPVYWFLGKIHSKRSENEHKT
jgi:hypothetical protein